MNRIPLWLLCLLMAIAVQGCKSKRKEARELEPARASATTVVTKEAFKKVLADRRPRFRQCRVPLEKPVQEAIDRSGVYVTVSVRADGKVGRAQVKIRENVKDERFSRCMAGQLGGIRLPPPGRALAIRHPLSLR